MANQQSPIGVFDSGVGGISTLGRIVHLLPHENIIYYGDTAHAPYGTKTAEQVLDCVRSVMDTLTARDVKAVVIACNTATSAAAAVLRQEMSLPIIGIEPALKPAHELRTGGRILVLATPVTLKLPKFAALYARYGEGAIPVPCPGLMELVEHLDLDGARVYLQDKLAPYASDTLDAVVLGCTHYVFLSSIVRELVPAHTAVLDGNEGTARQLRRILEERSLLADRECPGDVRFLFSGHETERTPVIRRLWQMAGEMASE